MKRTLVIIMGLGILAAAYFGSRLFAQGPGAPQGGPVATKIGVVNIGNVFLKYKKAELFKQEVDREAKPYKDKIEELKKLALSWQNYMVEASKKAPLSVEDRKKAEETILQCKRGIEDQEREARNKIGKKNEEQIVQLYREVNDAIKAYSQTSGFHLILGFGEPLDQDLLSFGNINRKMQAMDIGSVVPMYTAQGLDITDGVIQLLNARFPGGNVQGVGFTQPGQK